MLHVRSNIPTRLTSSLARLLAWCASFDMVRCTCCHLPVGMCNIVTEHGVGTHRFRSNLCCRFHLVSFPLGHTSTLGLELGTQLWFVDWITDEIVSLSVQTVFCCFAASFKLLLLVTGAGAKAGTFSLQAEKHPSNFPCRLMISTTSLCVQWSRVTFWCVNCDTSICNQVSVLITMCVSSAGACNANLQIMFDSLAHFHPCSGGVEPPCMFCLSTTFSCIVFHFVFHRLPLPTWIEATTLDAQKPLVHFRNDCLSTNEWTNPIKIRTALSRSPTINLINNNNINFHPQFLQLNNS